MFVGPFVQKRSLDRIEKGGEEKMITMTTTIDATSTSMCYKLARAERDSPAAAVAVGHASPPPTVVRTYDIVFYNAFVGYATRR